MRLIILSLLTACSLFASTAFAQEAEQQVESHAHAEATDSRAAGGDGFQGADCNGECTAALTAWSGCPDDPCGGICLAGKCYEVRPVIAGRIQTPEGELAGAEVPGGQDEDAALIAWEGCPEIPCGGLCLAGLCYEVRPLTPMQSVCER